VKVKLAFNDDRRRKMLRDEMEKERRTRAAAASRILPDASGSSGPAAPMTLLSSKPERTLSDTPQLVTEETEHEAAAADDAADECGDSDGTPE